MRGAFIVERTVKLRHCCECAYLVAFNNYNPAPSGYRPESHWCRKRQRSIEDPGEHIACCEFVDAKETGDMFRFPGDRRCTECPKFSSYEKSGIVDNILRKIRINECSGNRGMEIRFPNMLRACDEDLDDDDEPETQTFRVTFVANQTVYQTIDVEAEDICEARKLAWDKCILEDAEIDCIEEVDRMSTETCRIPTLSDIQTMMESVGSMRIQDLDPDRICSYITIRFSTQAPLRIRFRVLNLVSSRISAPISILYGGDCIVAWNVSEKQYVSLGCNLAEYISQDGIVDIEWCCAEVVE